MTEEEFKEKIISQDWVDPDGGQSLFRTFPEYLEKILIVFRSEGEEAGLQKFRDCQFEFIKWLNGMDAN